MSLTLTWKMLYSMKLVLLLFKGRPGRLDVAPIRVHRPADDALRCRMPHGGRLRDFVDLAMRYRISVGVVTI